MSNRLSKTNIPLMAADVVNSRSEITGLTEGVQYYVGLWVETSDGVKYGEEKTCVLLGSWTAYDVTDGDK